jgi:hypothetical protein
MTIKPWRLSTGTIATKRRRFPIFKAFLFKYYIYPACPMTPPGDPVEWITAALVVIFVVIVIVARWLWR